MPAIAATLAGCGSSVPEGLGGGAPDAQAPSIADLPPLEGDLTVYLGRGEGGLYERIVGFLEDHYELSVTLQRGPSASLANTLQSEAEANAVNADVFWSIDAASLGQVAASGLARPLESTTTDAVPARFRDDEGRWVGVSGRARAMPFDPTVLDRSDLPDRVLDLPDLAVEGPIGWAPTYGSFQAFVTAMIALEGRARTRSFLEAMVERGVRSYAGEFTVTLNVGTGAIPLGLANHYYALRLVSARPDIDLKLGFTDGGAGSLINVGGALVLAATDRPGTAERFVRHLHTREVQGFLANQAYEYPLVEGIDPPAAGDITMPPLDELNPPKLDLTALADLETTLALLRETGVR